MHPITVHDDLPDAQTRVVDTGLDVANAEAAPLHAVRPLSCFARDDAGSVIAGAIGRTWGACCELQQLWVDPARRRRGLGRRLVEHFEARAVERGCAVFYLETFSFQAPSLYRRLGYAVECTLEGFAPGVEKYLMVRRGRPRDGPTPLRPATTADALAISALATQVFLDTYAPDGIDDAIVRHARSTLPLEAVLAAVCDPNQRIVVAASDGRIIGFAQVRQSSDRTAELERLYVQRPSLGRGIGSALLERAEDLAREAGASALWLTAWVGNVRAHAFYIGHAYRDVGATEHVFEDRRFENRLLSKALATADQ